MSIIEKLQEEIKNIVNQKQLINFQSRLSNLREADKISSKAAKELSVAARDYLEFIEDYQQSKTNSGQSEMEAQQAEAIDYSQYTDLELVEDGAFMPFLEYQFKIQWNHQMTQTMFNVYYALCYYANSVGEVSGQATQDIAEFIGHSSDSKVVEAISKLEEAKLIIVNRQDIINSYVITGYKKAFIKSGKGAYNLPLEMFRKLQNYNLKHYRLVWYLVAHKHHMPNNTGKTGIKQTTLKNITNAVSYKELRQLIQDLAGVIFETVDNFWTKIKRVLMKSLRLTFNFIQLGIGIVEDTIEEVESHHLYERVKSLLVNMRIDSTKKNIKKVIKKTGGISEFVFNEVENLSKLPHIFSKYNTVNCLLKLLESKDQALRVKS
ncbi:hypothetical protein BX659_12711 [Orenia metallireducens]|uniref:Uncharacterized protein n=1 Tax=Orenia metallireducens TaxID=1413210 RepID=A0A285I372_9FIRM|nr:hypothetical protein [Orenia metallireducens]PRX23119.1 hypothetical protein BX659_12711 [Orenia metallireducens]SNY42410.1 hypothetical protein SAMN06265827_13011 [Orenia metallireducens]